MGCGHHPVEVVGRVRGQPDIRDEPSAVQVQPSGQLRVRTDQGCRDFVLDGVSIGQTENLQAFYTKYVKARVDDIKGGAKCTVMMYGPTGSGKSHTMFGSTQEPGVAYLALQQLLINKPVSPCPDPLTLSPGTGPGSMVKATVLEIYNEEIFDLLASNSVASPGPRSLRATSLGRARLDVRGKKVRNATSISGCDARTLVREIAKVERRRVVKSTNCNDHSSRSHCMVIIDVLAVGGRLLLVDMAGSENMEQAGLGIEAKLQTGKINQGNGALKRVVEAIANGDPYIPYRDSKLTMVLQDSFEDNRTKILMILCLSPHLKDAHKTICTLEYGARAKTIVRLPVSPLKDDVAFGEEMIMEARLHSKDECIKRLRRENEQIERVKGELEERLSKQELALSELQQKIAVMEAEKRDQYEQILKFKCHEDGVKQLCERERLIAEQKEEIAILRLRADKAEAQVIQLQSFIYENDKVTGMTTVETQSWMENASEGRDDENGLREVEIREHIPSCTLDKLPESAYSGIGEGESEQVHDLQVDHSTINRVLFARSKEMDCSEHYDKDDEKSMSDEEDETSSDDMGLCKTGWLPIIHEELDEDDNSEDEPEEDVNPSVISHDDTDCSPGATACQITTHLITPGRNSATNGSICSTPGPVVASEIVRNCCTLVDKSVGQSVTSCNTSVLVVPAACKIETHCSTADDSTASKHHLTKYSIEDPIAENQPTTYFSANSSCLDATSCSDISIYDAIKENAPRCSMSDWKSPISTVDSQQSMRKDVQSSAAARRARIENIFLLCGDSREVAARRNANHYSPSNFSMPACSLKQSKEKSDEPVLLSGTPGKTQLAADFSWASPNHSSNQGSSRSMAAHRPSTKHRLFTNPDLATMPFQALENEMPTKGSGSKHSSSSGVKSKSLNSFGSEKVGKTSSGMRSSVLEQLKGFENGNWGAQGVTVVEKARAMHVQELASKLLK
ncbi:hypothetical protein O6H91_01G175300 [Diphasiastrum complanatum]|uniref:Uncharacterized protein n=1 Tax=Diphasiastrum complanatum TaxID=34168 RepID=A0ACC2EZ13_DIPCM|nr:hypothetical protein O6H91_01G175300 [Diphasiastrum complanatum]